MATTETGRRPPPTTSRTRPPSTGRRTTTGTGTTANTPTKPTATKTTSTKNTSTKNTSTKTSASSSLSSSAVPAGIVIGQDSFWIPNLYRLNWQSSVVIGDVLYIDGGQVQNGSFNFASKSTVALALSQSWSPADVMPMAVFDKPDDFPLTLRPYLWYNTKNDRLQTFGGTTYATIRTWSVEKQEEGPNFEGEPRALWSLDPDTRQWKKGKQPPSGYSSAFWSYANVAASPNAWYGQGGAAVPFGFTRSNALLYNRVVTLDYDTGTWTNKTSTGFAATGYGGFGNALYSDAFGDEGVIIYFGGYMANNGMFIPKDGSSLQDMSQITIYDIATGEYLTQTATGGGITPQHLPPPRIYACATTATDKSGHVDIFVTGGIGDIGTHSLGQLDQTPDPELAGVWVLSLPSFAWTWIPGSNQTMRYGSTCQTIGNRHMVVVGGYNPSMQTGTSIGVDPWPNAIGLFDMSALQWTTHYNAAAGVYKRNSAIANAAKNQPEPPSWDSAKVRKVFNTSPSGGNSGSDAGAIAGGVVGGVVGLALILFLLWWFVIRPRRKSKKTADAEKSTTGTRTLNASTAEFGTEGTDHTLNASSTMVGTETTEQSRKTTRSRRSLRSRLSGMSRGSARSTKAAELDASVGPYYEKDTVPDRPRFELESNEAQSPLPSLPQSPQQSTLQSPVSAATPVGTGLYTMMDLGREDSN